MRGSYLPGNQLRRSRRQPRDFAPISPLVNVNLSHSAQNSGEALVGIASEPVAGDPALARFFVHSFGVDARD
jgi:hypothetical protein